MRKRFKVLASFLAAVMILSSLSVIVFADNEVVTSGKVSQYNYYSETEVTYYEYWLYTNGDFKVKYYQGDINFSDFDDEILNAICNVEIDCSESNSLPNVYGGNCKANSVKFTGFSGQLYRYYISNFPNAQSIDFPEGTIGTYMTFSHMGITSLDFLEDLNVKNLSLQYCNSLTEIDVPSTVTYLNIQGAASLTDIVVSSDELIMLDIYECPALKNISSDSNLRNIRWFDIEATELVVPEYVNTCTLVSDNLKKATIPSGITRVSGGMFIRCPNLTEVVIPSSVTEVQYSAFRNCGSLKSINLPSTVKNIYTFAFAGSGLESFTFPSSLINIEYKVFADCKNLKSVTIPTSVECIDATAFAGCTALTDVYYQGTEAQWNQIMFDPEDVSVSKIFNNATIHFNVQTGWSKSGNTWYYYDETGSQAKGWKEIKDKWYYFDNNGAMQTGWKQVNSKWYYFNSDGDMATGWKKTNNNWYYLDSEGAMKTGWLQSGSNWYYLNSDGEMVTGWKQINSKWYYFSDGGEMVTGWKSSGGKWYYFSDDGDMATGWIEDDGEWYYLKSDGSMSSNEYCDGYWLNSSGIWSYKYKASWRQNSTGWWYGDETGWYAKDETLVIDGVSYDFDGAGYLA